MDYLNEMSLRKIPEIQSFKDWIENNKNIRHTNPGIRGYFDYIQAALNSYGFDLIGDGGSADVYGNPSYPYVIKIFVNDPAYLKWWNFCKKNQNNPYVPVVKGGMVNFCDYFKLDKSKWSNHIYLVRLEKLSRLPYNGDLYRQYLDLYSALQRNAPSYNKYIDDISKFINSDSTMMPDLHRGNFMVRNDKDVVIIDPVA